MSPPFGPQLWEAAQPCGSSVTTGGIALASLRYDQLTPVTGVAGPRCLAGNPLPDCVLACLSLVASKASGDVLSPRKLHHLSEEEDPKKTAGRTIYLDICKTYDPDATEKV